MTSRTHDVHFDVQFDPIRGGPSIQQRLATSTSRATRCASALAHHTGMSNHTIATPISSWAELRATDREVLNRTEAARLLDIDERTLTKAIEDGTIPSVRLGRRVLIPKRPFMETFGLGEAS